MIETNRRKTDLKIRPVKNYRGKGAKTAREERCCRKLSRRFPGEAFRRAVTISPGVFFMCAEYFYTEID